MCARCSFSLTSKHSTAPSLSARGDDGDLARERHEGFDDARLSADLAPRGREIGAVVDDCLAFAVVAEPPRLEHRRPADPVERGGEL